MHMLPSDCALSSHLLRLRSLGSVRKQDEAGVTAVLPVTCVHTVLPQGQNPNLLSPPPYTQCCPNATTHPPYLNISLSSTMKCWTVYTLQLPLFTLTVSQLKRAQHWMLVTIEPCPVDAPPGPCLSLPLSLVSPSSCGKFERQGRQRERYAW